MELPPSPSASQSETAFPLLFKRKSKIYNKIVGLVEANRGLNFDQRFIDFDAYCETAGDQAKKLGKDHARDYRARRNIYIEFLEKRIFTLLDYVFESRRRMNAMAGGFMSLLHELYAKFDDYRGEMGRQFAFTPISTHAVSAFCERQIGLQERLAKMHLQMTAAQMTPEFLPAVIREIKAPPSPLVQQRLSALQRQHKSILDDLHVVGCRIAFQLREWQRVLGNLTADGVVTSVELTAAARSILPPSSTDVVQPRGVHDFDATGPRPVAATPQTKARDNN